MTGSKIIALHHREKGPLNGHHLVQNNRVNYRQVTSSGYMLFNVYQVVRCGGSVN